MSKGTKGKKQGKTTKAKTAGKAAGKPATKPAEAAVSDTMETEAKEPANAAPKPMSCLDAAVAVLKDKGEPMRCKEMVNAMFEKKLWHSDAPTPAATLSSAILREVTHKGDKARFKKVGRGQFALNG